MQQIISKNEVLEILFDKMPYVFWKGKDGKYQGANSNYLNNLGLTSPDEFVGKTIFEVLKNNISLAQSIEETDSRIMNDGIELVILKNAVEI